MDTVSNVNKLRWHNHDKIFLSHPPFQSEAVSFCHIPFPRICSMLHAVSIQPRKGLQNRITEYAAAKL